MDRYFTKEPLVMDDYYSTTTAADKEVQSAVMVPGGEDALF